MNSQNFAAASRLEAAELLNKVEPVPFAFYLRMSANPTTGESETKRNFTYESELQFRATCQKAHIFIDVHPETSALEVKEQLKQMQTFLDEALEHRDAKNLQLAQARKFLDEIGEEGVRVVNKLITEGEYSPEFDSDCEDCPF